MIETHARVTATCDNCGRREVFTESLWSFIKDTIAGQRRAANKFHAAGWTFTLVPGGDRCPKCQPKGEPMSTRRSKKPKPEFRAETFGPDGAAPGTVDEVTNLPLCVREQPTPMQRFEIKDQANYCVGTACGPTHANLFARSPEVAKEARELLLALDRQRTNPGKLSDNLARVAEENLRGALDGDDLEDDAEHVH